MEVETNSAEEISGKLLHLTDLSLSSPPSAELPQDYVWEFNYNGTDIIISKYHIISFVLAIGMLIGFILGRAQRACCCHRRVADVNQRNAVREVEMNPSSCSSTSSSSTSSSTSSPPRRIRKPMKLTKPMKMKSKAMSHKPGHKKEDRQQSRLSTLDREFGIGFGMNHRAPQPFFHGPNFPYNPQLSVPTGNQQIPHREFFPPTAPPPPPGVIPVTLNNTGFNAEPGNPGQRVQAQPGQGHDSVWIG